MPVDLSRYTADYDMAEFDLEDVVEWRKFEELGLNRGSQWKHRIVGILPEWDGEGVAGLVFVTDCGIGIAPGYIQEYERPFRRLVGYTVARALGGNVPTHVGGPWTGSYVAVEGVEGEIVRKAQRKYLRKVDRDRFYEQAAIQILCGTRDLHQFNVLVTPDGDVVIIDLDHAAYDVTAPLQGEDGTDLQSILFDLSKTAATIFEDDRAQSRCRMLREALELANEVRGSDRLDRAIDEAAEFDEEMATTIEGNVETLSGESTADTLDKHSTEISP